MQWDELSSGALAAAGRRCSGLCLLPFGVIERHGRHLPLGTDQICADEVARRAAEREPAVVFPSYYFGKIFTARHTPGTVALSRKLLLPLLEATVDEIARNGFNRILILNGHGGNTSTLHHFLRSLLEEPRSHLVYSTNYYELHEEARQRWNEMRETDHGEHADEMETSVMLFLRPDLVHMDALAGPEDGQARGRQKHLPHLDNPMGWYADYPTHYAGDARRASAEKGRFIVQAWVDRVVRQMQAIKSDEVTPELLQQFYSRARHPQREPD